MSLADNYPVGMDFCTSQGLNGIAIMFVGNWQTLNVQF